MASVLCKVLMLEWTMETQCERCTGNGMLGFFAGKKASLVNMPVILRHLTICF